MAFAKGVSFADAFEGDRSSDEILLDYLMDLCVMTYDAMEELGINQQELARRMGKKESQISRMLSGEANITLKTLSQIDEALGLGIEFTCGSRTLISSKSDYTSMASVEKKQQPSSQAATVSMLVNCLDGMMAA